MKKSTSLRQLLLALMCLFGLTASAQYEATLVQGPTTDYSNVGADFKLTDVAETLGTDTATLAAQLADIANTKVFAVIDSTGTVTGYTGNTGEFWLNAYGQVHEYSGAAWFVGQSYSVEDNVFRVYVGQYPSYFSASDTVKVQAALVYGDKTATFDITYQVYVPEAPDAELAISKLNMVGEASASIEQYPRTGYDTDYVYVKISDIAEKLGCDKTDFAYIAGKLAYMPTLDATYGTMSDSLTLYTTYDGWAKRALASNGDSLWACGATAYAADDNLFLQNISYDATNDTLSCTIGQYPGTLKAGDKPYIDIYFVYGSNAYKVTYTVNIVEAPYQGLEDMTKVGEETVTVKMDIDTNYGTKSVNPDVDAIAAALGVDAANISLQAIDTNGSLSSSSTANNGGYWLTQEGIITAWGSTAKWFVEPATSGDYSTLNVGQYPNGLAEGDTAHVSLYFVAGENYYVYNVILAINKVDAAPQTEWVSVANRTLNIQAVPSDYVWSTVDASISTDDINAAIGTTDPVLYAYISDTLRKANPDTYPAEKIYTKTYNMNPSPGFWVNAAGESRGWVSDEQSPWGMYIENKNGKVSFYTMQFAADVAGTSYQGKFFLVNEETGKMMTVTLNYRIVNKIQTITEVGSTTITVPVSLSDYEADFDLTAAATALGTDVETLVNGYPLVGRAADGTYSDGTALENGIMFTNDGYCDNEGGNIGFSISENGTKLIVYANSEDELGTGYKAEAAAGIMVTGENDEVKVYVINIVFMNAEDYATGINDVKQNAKNDGKIYDLSGRQISKPAHGLYIMNGKKFVVK